ncbi:DUF2244 domain-containing protein [Glaciecola sp. MH2013]|uniref:DUF2244 domain-containing protein n=1 Tax=Glaciecola sp. MH2013 TaxID=2785524 RepID=UPI00189D8CCC|nr:DUF2244 domain-containing protein [Glaciecola sp. MH2013]MBF7073311.1 DUF2244 domain-containing protein [Glaciecola sp. MH2013]
MVKLEYNEHREAVITLTPNRSLTWQQAKWIILIMVSVVMIIALAWTFVGAWVVLPFAGLEVGLFAFLMYKVTRFTYLQQIVRFDENHISVKTGINKVMRHETLLRQGTDIYYSETDRNWTTPKITLKNGSSKIQLGTFLNADDMAVLREKLESLGFPICREHWWK